MKLHVQRSFHTSAVTNSLFGFSTQILELTFISQDMIIIDVFTSPLSFMLLKMLF